MTDKSEYTLIVVLANGVPFYYPVDTAFVTLFDLKSLSSDCVVRYLLSDWHSLTLNMAHVASIEIVRTDELGGKE